jgi:hypothetical protein
MQGNKERKMTAFQDHRVYLVPCSMKPDFIGYSQSHDGPIHIHVGTGLSDAKLLDVWEKRERFPTLAREQLIAARDGKFNKIKVA